MSFGLKSKFEREGKMEGEKSGLKRGLTLVTMFTLMTGAMVGMAWAVLANVFLDRGGPAIVISLLIAAILSIFIGLCYAELCAAMPKAGGEYIYVKRALKRFPGFITGVLMKVVFIIPEWQHSGMSG